MKQAIYCILIDQNIAYESRRKEQIMKDNVYEFTLSKSNQIMKAL